MVTHSSATERESHVNQTSRTNTIVNALKRRAQAVLNDKSIDAQSRAIIRYALEINDPWLAEMVRRADAGETLDFSQTPDRRDRRHDAARSNLNPITANSESGVQDIVAEIQGAIRRRSGIAR